MDKVLESIANNIVCFGILGTFIIVSVAYYIALSTIYIVQALKGKQDEK